MPNTVSRPRKTVSRLRPNTTDVFHVIQVTRGTLLADAVGADLVRVDPHRASQTHRHNHAETVLYILEGTATIRVGDGDVRARPGDRVIIPKGAYHQVRTQAEGLRFLSVQSPPIQNKAKGTLDLEPFRKQR